MLSAQAIERAARSREQGRDQRRSARFGEPRFRVRLGKREDIEHDPSAAPNPYETGLDQGPANSVPLSPIGFLLRAAAVYPDRPAVVYGGRRYSWRQALERSR